MTTQNRSGRMMSLDDACSRALACLTGIHLGYGWRMFWALDREIDAVSEEVAEALEMLASEIID